MKLLIVTQAVDIDHPILAFFHRWIAEFAAQCEQVTVISQQVGRHSLPTNVRIHSLGKEAGKSKLQQLWHFYRLNWQLRKDYDIVFVHMIPLYVVLGGPLWRLMKKQVGLWYTHGSVPLSLKIANHFTQHIFTAAAGSCNLQSKKVRVTGHGIDTEHFHPQPDTQKDIDLITVGRIAKSKNLITLIDILQTVRESHAVSLTIVGVAVTGEEQAYETKLRAHIAAANLTNHVHFIGRVSQAELPQTLNRARIFVTTAQNGSLDKAMLEAMACGLPVVSMAPGSASLPLGSNQVNTKGEFIFRVTELCKEGFMLHRKNTEYIKEQHSLYSLVLKLLSKK